MMGPSHKDPFFSGETAALLQALVRQIMGPSRKDMAEFNTLWWVAACMVVRAGVCLGHLL